MFIYLFIEIVKIGEVHGCLKTECIVRTWVFGLCSRLEFKSLDPEVKMGKFFKLLPISVIYLDY